MELRTGLQRSTGMIPTPSILIASLGIGIGTHSFLSLQERDHALVGGMSGFSFASKDSQIMNTHAPVRFAEIESITTLALMVMHYEISVTEDPRFVHETWAQRRDRVMGAYQGTITVTPTGVPLTFKRRVD